MALDRDGPDLDLGTEVFVRPAEVLPGLHSAPLVRRMRLWDEVGDARHDVGIPAGHFLTDPGDLFGHGNDTVEVGGALAGESAHEVELHLTPAAAEGFGGTVVEVLVVDRLA